MQWVLSDRRQDLTIFEVLIEKYIYICSLGEEKHSHSMTLSPLGLIMVVMCLVQFGVLIYLQTSPKIFTSHQ